MRCYIHLWDTNTLLVIKKNSAQSKSVVQICLVSLPDFIHLGCTLLSAKCMWKCSTGGLVLVQGIETILYFY